MNRLQKKCLIGSAGCHLLLLVILLVGPAFLAAHRKPADDLPVLDFIPAMAVDAKMSGGGTPNATPPPPKPVVTPPAPAPQPPVQPKPVEPPPEPRPEPKPEKSFIEKLFTPEPPKPDPEAIDTSSDKKVVVKPTAKPKIEVSNKLVKRTATKDTSEEDAKAEARAEARAEAKAAAARAKAYSSAVASLRSNLSSTTHVDVPGPGGASYANYSQIVKSIYTQAWIAPDGVSDDEATAKVTIVVARDGSIISARVTDPSGDAAVDRSVREALRRVDSLPAFPEGATDDQRTFIINFNLKAKRLLG
jgi:periplasmic protein TonB